MMAVKTILAGLCAAALLAFAPAETKAADPIKLKLAYPQPDPSELKPGLKVRYYYQMVRTLLDAGRYMNDAVQGPPLVGFDYPNTLPREKALTSEKATGVIAVIDGYMRFDTTGVHRLEFFSNDGLQVGLGGTRIYRHDLRQPCTTSGEVKVDVPSPGWYDVSALFFQRYKTSCLLLKIGKPGGGLTWASNDIWGYK